jgi:hypothetical protein
MGAFNPVTGWQSRVVDKLLKAGAENRIARGRLTRGSYAHTPSGFHLRNALADHLFNFIE